MGVYYEGNLGSGVSRIKYNLLYADFSDPLVDQNVDFV